MNIAKEIDKLEKHIKENNRIRIIDMPQQTQVRYKGHIITCIGKFDDQKSILISGNWSDNEPDVFIYENPLPDYCTSWTSTVHILIEFFSRTSPIFYITKLEIEE